MVLVLATVGCVKTKPEPTEDAAAAKPSVIEAPKATTRDASPEGALSLGGRDAALPPLSTKSKVDILADLKAGRTLAQAGKWAEAKAAYEKALAIDPGNATVLSELSWAYVNLSEWDRAIETGELALRGAYDAKTRAAILYNIGRGFEGKGSPMEAAVRYRQSLERRPNAIVQKRLDDISKKVKDDLVVKAEAKNAPPEPPCKRRFTDELAFFQCLEGVNDEAFLKTPIVPGKEPSSGLVPPFSIVRYGNEGPGLSVFLLVRTTSEGAMETAAELGRAWNPGAFGVHEEYTYTSSKETAYGKRKVVEVYGRHAHADADYGGLSLATVTTETVVVCAYEGDERARCTQPLVVGVTETQTYPLDPKGLSPEDTALLNVLRKDKPPGTVSARAELSITADQATITRTTGPAELLTSLGKFSLR
jgi:tetratricopeptide (TPR) repeat protein